MARRNRERRKPQLSLECSPKRFREFLRALEGPAPLLSDFNTASRVEIEGGMQKQGSHYCAVKRLPGHKQWLSMSLVALVVFARAFFPTCDCHCGFHNGTGSQALIPETFFFYLHDHCIARFTWITKQSCSNQSLFKEATAVKPLYLMF